MSDVPKLDGPVQPPAGGGPARALVVLLHGWGADGEDLVGLAAAWSRFMPEARFVVPHAPYTCDQNPMGRQWFGFTDASAEQIAAGAANARGIIDRFVDDELAGLGLADERLVLAGFSQGAMMALHVALRRAACCAAVVSYSGALIDGAALTGEIRARPPVLLAHGDADTVVPFRSLDAAATALAALDVPVRSHVARGIGHGIDDAGVILGGEFIAEALGA